MEEVNIKDIRIGDAVLHEGYIRTVGANNLKHSDFMGITLWGDSYKLGYKLVKRITHGSK